MLALLFSIVLLAAILVVGPRHAGGGWVVAADLVLVALVLGMGFLAPTVRWLGWLADWYLAPLIYLFYVQTCLVVRAIHDGRLYDGVLIDIDRRLFGVDPTRWLASYAHPVLTEILQVAYSSFYLLLLVTAWDIRRSGRRQSFDLLSFGVLYGFGLSWAGYVLLPSVGPRFVLHPFSALDSDLPGLLLTPYLRAFVNWGGSVVSGVGGQEAINRVLPDVFPSGHTMMTLALMFWSFRFSSRFRFLVVTIGSLLIAGTVYLRYHYVIDVLAGSALAVFCLVSYARVHQMAQTLALRFPLYGR